MATMAAAGPSTDEAFENLADEYISDLVNFSPVQATLVGDHSADDRVAIRGAENLREGADVKIMVSQSKPQAATTGG